MPDVVLGRLDGHTEVLTAPGDTVLDPMCGSGTTGAAAKSLGRDFILMDENPRAIQLTRERLGLPAQSNNAGLNP